MENEKQLTIQEKWAIDMQLYSKGVHIPTKKPQCQRCKFYVPGDALHCKTYAVEEKPNYVLFPKKECEFYIYKNPISFVNLDSKRKRLYGAHLGLIIADMLGVPVEFSSREERKSDPVTGLRAYGTYHQPFGAWSDDSSLMLCLIQAINDGFSLEKTAKYMVDYKNQGLFTPEGKMFDIGITCANAIKKMEAGVIPEKCGESDEHSNGNGSLMRILPLAFYLHGKSSEEKIDIIEKVSSLTHGHDRSKFACIFYVEMVSALINGLDPVTAMNQAIRFVTTSLPQNYESEHKTFERLLNGNIAELSEEDIRSTGYVLDTLEAAVWCFLTTASYKDAVLKAVNLGGDTDTVAAVTGGLAGAFYGVDGLDARWVGTILKIDEILDMLDKFSNKVNL